MILDEILKNYKEDKNEKNTENLLNAETMLLANIENIHEKNNEDAKNMIRSALDNYKNINSYDINILKQEDNDLYEQVVKRENAKEIPARMVYQELVFCLADDINIKSLKIDLPDIIYSKDINDGAENLIKNSNKIIDSFEI